MDVAYESPKAREDLSPELYGLTMRLLNAVERGAPGGESARTILISSARPSEGKSFTAMALARALTRLVGPKVLLIDANFRHPTLHRAFGLPNGYGLSTALVNRGFDPGLPVPVNRRLSVLPAGDTARQGLLFQSAVARKLLADVRRHYGTVIVDGGTLDTCGALARAADGIVLVVDAQRTRQEVIRGAMRQVGLPASHYLGVVRNRQPKYIPDLLYRLL